MKKLIFAAALILLAGVAYGQHLQKGVILGVHNVTITLKPDVTMDQFLDAWKKNISEAEKMFDGWKGFLVKGNKGENVNEYGLVWYIESVEAYNKYYKKDESETEEMVILRDKFQPELDELERWGTWTSKYTDWVIQ